MTGNDFIFTNDLTDATPDVCHEYSVYAFCNAGSCTFDIGQRHFFMDSHCALIKPHGGPIDNLNCSSDFSVECTFVSNDYLNVFLPRTDTSVMGVLRLIHNPIIKLSPQQKKLEKAVLGTVKTRYEDYTHLYRQEVLVRSLETFIFDVYDIVHKQNRPATTAPSQSMRIFNRFINLLRQGEFRQHRDVAYYANKLFISPKYLTEACRKCIDFPASYWIDFFATEAIVEKLNDTTIPLAEISSMFNFSTQAHFSRYVKAKLKMSPKIFRDSLATLNRNCCRSV